MSDINLCNIHKWQGYGNCPDCPAPDEDLGNRLQEAHYEIERLSSVGKRMKYALDTLKLFAEADGAIERSLVVDLVDFVFEVPK